jgi:hypothetical protein
MDSDTRTIQHLCVISGYRRDVDEACDILGHPAAQNGNLVPTFRYISVPSLMVKKCNNKTGPKGCPETSPRKYHPALRYTQEQRKSSHFVRYLYDSLRDIITLCLIHFLADPIVSERSNGSLLEWYFHMNDFVTQIFMPEIYAYIPPPLFLLHCG